MSISAFLADPTVVMTLKLALATVLGMLIGAERVSAGKQAGARTFALAAMGACLFVVMSITVSSAYLGLVNFDPLRISAAVIQGIGFIGAGLIFVREKELQGLTTAAGLWVAAGVGMAVGFGLYALALVGTILTLLTFTAMWFFEERIRSYQLYWERTRVAPLTSRTTSANEDEHGM